MRIGIIGGTGIETRLSEGAGLGRLGPVECDTPFGRPSGPLLTGSIDSVPVAVLARHGAGHVHNPATVPYRANIYALKSVGCTHLVAFGATGSLRERIEPGDLVVCDQVIDRTEGRPRTFFDSAAVHVEFAEPFCPVVRGWLQAAAGRVEGVTVHDGGCYVCIQGPSFSSRAEAEMHRLWGADVVGMTALPEARLAREAEMAYALVALATDYDCWRERPRDGESDSILQSVLANLGRASEASFQLLRSALTDVSGLERTPSPAHTALAHAVWSDRSVLNPAELERLGILWPGA